MPAPTDPALDMPGPERYRYLVAHVGRTGELWLLESPEWTLTLETVAGQELLPVWPTEESALAARTPAEMEAGFVATPRTLADWLERSTPALIEDGVLVGIFPDRDRSCPVVPAGMLARDLAGPRLQGTDLARLRRRLERRRRK